MTTPVTAGPPLEGVPAPPQNPSPGGGRRRVALIVLTLSAVVGGLVIVRAVNSLFPWAGVRDDPTIEPKDLATLALASSQYVQTLATAVFGGAVLALGEGVLGKERIPLGIWPRVLIALGFLSLILSLSAGFVGIEALVEAADQGIIDDKMTGLRELRILQSFFLLFGVIVTAISLIWNLLEESGSSQP